jgi:asparagine synthase (glutamine-hydrolysing)
MEQTPDVEMILHAYAIWGEACLEHLQGDFAFAIWDARRQRLFCARDQFGVAQFYYAPVGTTLLFGNTLNCLRLHPGVSDTLNEEAIADFLLFSMNTDPATTTFADIRRLPPAHMLVWSARGLHIQRYWALPEPDGYVHYRRAEEYVERFRTLFDQAVEDRLRTDRLGMHLSGGMDSTSIAVTAYRLLQARGQQCDMRAYTIVYDRLIPDDEGQYAAQVAAAIDAPHEFLVAENYITRQVPTPPVDTTPEPVLPPTLTAEYEIVCRVAQSSRVLLMGFGGDPVLQPEPGAWRQALQQGYSSYLLAGAWRRLRRHLRRQPGPRRPVPSCPDWINPEFAARTGLRGRLEQYWAQGNALRGRHGMTTAPLWSAIFTWSDPGFHRLPVRARFPFFDQRLVRYLLRVPPVPWMQQKQLLRQAMQGLLVAAVRQRPKTPLHGHPWYALLHERGLLPWMEKSLETPGLEPYVDTQRLSALLRAPATLTQGLCNQAWPVFSLAYWLCYQRRPDGEPAVREGRDLATVVPWNRE